MITWTGENGDYTAKVGEYELKVFKWQELVWQYNLYRNHYRIDTASFITLEQAKEAAEKALHEHLKKEK